MDSAGDDATDSVGEEGAEGYDWRRSTNAVEMSIERKGGFRRSTGGQAARWYVHSTRNMINNDIRL